jgi:hypothetical protein
METMTPTYEQLELDLPAPLCRYEVLVTVNDEVIMDLKIPADTLRDAEDAITATMQHVQASLGVTIAHCTSLSWVGLKQGDIWRGAVNSIPLHDG